MTWPNFIIIGAAKSGTSSLFSYLGQHPEIYTSTTKEPNYFALAGREPSFSGPGDDIVNKTSVVDADRYRALFRGARPGMAVGEASTLYLYHPEAAARMRREIPAVRLIAVLRNPVERAYSSYLHMVRDGREPLGTFEAALSAEEERVEAGWEALWHYRRMGCYYGQLARYFERFPKEQIRVLLHEDLEHNLRGVMQALFSYLNVDPGFEPDLSVRQKVAGTARSSAIHALLTRPNPVKSFVKRVLPVTVRRPLYDALMRRNVVARKAPLAPGTRARLAGMYDEELDRLSRLIGRDLSPWRADVASPA